MVISDITEEMKYLLRFPYHHLNIDILYPNDTPILGECAHLKELYHVIFEQFRIKYVYVCEYIR